MLFGLLYELRQSLCAYSANVLSGSTYHWRCSASGASSQLKDSTRDPNYSTQQQQPTESSTLDRQRLFTRTFSTHWRQSKRSMMFGGAGNYRPLSLLCVACFLLYFSAPLSAPLSALFIYGLTGYLMQRRRSTALIYSALGLKLVILSLWLPGGCEPCTHHALCTHALCTLNGRGSSAQRPSQWRSINKSTSNGLHAQPYRLATIARL